MSVSAQLRKLPLLAQADAARPGGTVATAERLLELAASPHRGVGATVRGEALRLAVI